MVRKFFKEYIKFDDQSEEYFVGQLLREVSFNFCLEDLSTILKIMNLYPNGFTMLYKPQVLNRVPLPISESRAIYILKCVAFTLANAEQRGIIHRDIKPDNILIGYRNNIYIADWGIAKYMNFFVKTNSLLVQALHYRAPELLVKVSSIDPKKIDVWSLGIVILHHDID